MEKLGKKPLPQKRFYLIDKNMKHLASSSIFSCFQEIERKRIGIGSKVERIGECTVMDISTDCMLILSSENGKVRKGSTSPFIVNVISE